MENILLKAAVKASNVKAAVSDRIKNTDSEENGDIVQTILIIALFVLIVVVAGNLLYNAIQGQAEQVADCIAGGGQTGDCQDYTSN